MRRLPLRDWLAEKGASFKERQGVEVPSVFKDLKTEQEIIRDKVGVTDFSYLQKFRISADNGIDFLDNIFPGDVAKIRFCRVLHTFLADKQGQLLADCYVANNDDDYIVFFESIIDDQRLKNILEENGAKDFGLEDITESHVVFSVDGYQAWAVVKDLFGADVLGLPYLSIEAYPFEGTDISLFRAGKTSEFGYLIMAPEEIGEKLMEKLLQSAEKYEGGLCGCKVHDQLRLEGRFFNIFAEGQGVKNPLALGLQWMIDFDKEDFIGREAILGKREKGLEKKIVGLKTGADIDLQAGAELYNQEQKVGTVYASCFSNLLNSRLGLALLPVEIAYAGLNFNLGAPDGPPVKTISMPPIVPKSLHVKLDEL